MIKPCLAKFNTKDLQVSNTHRQFKPTTYKERSVLPFVETSLNIQRTSKRFTRVTSCHMGAKRYCRKQIPPPAPLPGSLSPLPFSMRGKKREFYDSIFAAAIKRVREGLTTSPNILQCLTETMHDTQGMSTRRQSREKEI